MSVITGIVKGENGELLQFAGVIETDADGNKTGLSTLTGINGNYSLNYSGSGYVSSSYVGYKKKTVKVDGNNVNIQLDPENASFEEVVIETNKMKLNNAQKWGIFFMLLGTAYVIYDRVKTKKAA